MKTISYSVITVLLVLGLTNGCEKNSNQSSDIQGKVTGISVCKNLKQAVIFEDTPDTLSCVSYSYNAVEQKLYVKHANAGFNCCFDTILCDIALIGDTILIKETEQTETGCNCDCLYDVEMEISGIKEGSYKIKLMEPYVGEQTKLSGEIILDGLNDDSFCVTRKNYPWGGLEL